MKWFRRLWPIVLLFLAPILSRRAALAMPQYAARELHRGTLPHRSPTLFWRAGPRAMEAHAGLRVRFHFGGSQALAMVAQARRAMRVLRPPTNAGCGRRGASRCSRATPRRLARNRLVVIVPRTNPGRIGLPGDLARGGLKFVLGADAVPVGRQRRRASQLGAGSRARPLTTRVLRNVVSEEENVSPSSAAGSSAKPTPVSCTSDVTSAAARCARDRSPRRRT